MNLNILRPKKALNKAFLKIKSIRSDIEAFKANLKELLDNSNAVESEEFHKNLVADFLKKTYYDPNYFINTKGRNDLVIHNGNKAKSPVGVILEAKKPTNTGEMMSVDKSNTKAMQELVLYYLRERILEKNLEVKNLIITNIYEWFIFDANDFEKHFAQNKSLVKQFKDFENGSLSGTSTDFFYKEIAAPAIDAIKEEIPCTHFDFRDYEKPLRNSDLKDDIKLVALFKLLSPEHLLKKPFTNDSNSLDKKFYVELLHIIGLSEQKQGGKKIIERNPPKERNTGSLLEDAIIQIDSMDMMGRLDRPSQYGKTQEERLFHVGLELAITWINRVLFLKLLEAQLITYHEGDKSYAFLNYERIGSYDDLNSLFFQVLAKKHDERNADVIKAFKNVPYLNSSLFEPTEIEHNTLFISNLNDDKKIPILNGTVLKDTKGKRRTGEITTLQYLFDFLNSYDFSGEGSENIQEDNKTLINASVLGLIFEKINGYKDGSFFTPGFITMYMCRETIRKAVVQKFNEASLLTKSNPTPPLEGGRGEDFSISTNGKYQDITDIYNAIGSRGDFSHLEANDLINSIKICDPAVGSGHFLVSALNEIIAVKHDLGVLHDREGKLLRDYDVHVENDELIVTDYNGELFDYHPNNKESQRVQETMFHEKQTLIENCLFGVDINSNSVKICRLRLWIELLKNAYYKNETELETLPNIDINIKCGNSLISRFDLDEDLGVALRKSKWNMDSYRIAVQTYRNAENKEQKHEMERLIADIKGDFKTEISRNSKEQRAYDRESAKLYEKHITPKLFEETLSKSAKSKLKKEREKLEKKVIKLKGQLDEIKNNKIYENAFEWRFEFPEVLDDDGGFVGFDVVIGNPPYVDIKALDKNIVKLLFSTYKTTSNRINLYSIFVEKGYEILNRKGVFSYIIPNSILMNSSYSLLRTFIKDDLTEIVKLPDDVFEDATVETNILSLKKGDNSEYCNVIKYTAREDLDQIDIGRREVINKQIWDVYEDVRFNIYLTEKIATPIKKVKRNGELIGTVADFCLGITPYDKYKGHSQELIKSKAYHSNEKIDVLYKPLIKGANIVPYFVKPEITEYIKYGEWLGAKREERFFTDQRVIVRQIVSGKPPKIYASYTSEPYYFTQIGFSIIPHENGKAKLIAALLNSKLLNFYHEYLFLDIEKELFQKILIENCKKLPVILNGSDEISNLVDHILTAKQADSSADTSTLEREIDALVYRLYGLTYEEVKVVDDGFEMSEEEYLGDKLGKY